MEGLFLMRSARYTLVAIVAALTVSACGETGRLTPAASPSETTAASSAATQTEPPQEDTFTARGAVGLYKGIAGGKGRKCVGKGKFSDIYGGVQAVVSDKSGQTVAFGKLKRGRFTTSIPICTFFLTVKGVPSGLGFYSVEVGGYDEEFSEEDMKNGVTLFLQ